MTFLLHGARARVAHPSATHNNDLLAAHPLEEESLPHYSPEEFYPARLGEILNKRYQLVAKLGYGCYSTVWLARDAKQSRWQRRRFVAMKIAKTRRSEPYSTTRAARELEIASILKAGNPEHPGRKHVSLVETAFEIYNPLQGVHLCSVFQPHCITLEGFARTFEGGCVPLSLLQPICRDVLEGLRYIHDNCHIVHTDLKPDNVMLSLRNPALLARLADQERWIPSPRKKSFFSTIHTSMGVPPSEVAGAVGQAVIADFGLAVRGDGPLLYNRIQPLVYRSPEVVLGSDWSYSVDIWSFGMMVYELSHGCLIWDDHLWPVATEADLVGAMLASFGYPKEGVLNRGRRVGLFFDDHGRYRWHHLLPTTPGCAEATLPAQLPPALSDDPTILFGHFGLRMLRWRPEDRANADSLLRDQWLAFDYKTARIARRGHSASS